MQDGPATALTVDVGPLFSGSPQDRAYDVYRELRDRAPVMKVPGRRTWLISRYDDVRAVVRDPGTWSNRSAERVDTGLTEPSPPSPRTEAALAKGCPWVPTLLFQDGAEHRRQRAFVQPALGPSRVERLEATIPRIAHELVDRFPADGTVMFVRDFALPLPGEVFAEVFGVADGDRERFRRWSGDLVELGAPMEEERSVEIAEEYIEFQRYLVGRIENCPADAREDLLSQLVNGTPRVAAERQLSRPELVAISTQLLAAGSDPTTAALTALLHRMLTEPGLMAALRADRALIPAAIDETLRLDSPVALSQRTATRDTEIRGRRVQQGEMVIALHASANRDPRHWESPEEFRLGRPNIKDHLAFAQGPHYCIGSLLARATVRIGAEIMLERTARVELHGRPPLELRPELITRAYRELPLIISTRDGGRS